MDQEQILSQVRNFSLDASTRRRVSNPDQVALGYSDFQKRTEENLERRQVIKRELSEDDISFLTEIRVETVEALTELGIKDADKRIPTIDQTVVAINIYGDVSGLAGDGQWTLLRVPRGKPLREIGTRVKTAFQHENFHNVVLGKLRLFGSKNAINRISRVIQMGLNRDSNAGLMGFPDEGITNLFPLFCSKDETYVLEINYVWTVLFVIALLELITERSQSYETVRDAYKDMARSFADGDFSYFARLKEILLTMEGVTEKEATAFLRGINAMSQAEISQNGLPSNLDKTAKLIPELKKRLNELWQKHRNDETIKLSGFIGSIKI